MRILILGGSGVLSTDFTKLCIDLKNEVYIVNRGKRRNFIDERANLIIADLREESEEELRDKLCSKKYDVVVDFLSFKSEQMKKTLSVVEGLFTQYVFISSATAYVKDIPEQIITENTKIGNKNWDYAYQKSLCEEYLRQQDINYTIIRPYVTFGVSRIPFPIIPDGYYYTLIERIKENKPVVMLDDGKAVCTLTSTKDFAEVLYRLLSNSKAYKEAFHITSNNRQTWKEVYLTLCNLLEQKPNICSVTMNDIHKYMPEFEFILKGDKGQNMLFDNSKVLNAIGGYEFKYDLTTALSNSVNFFENTSEMQGIDYKFDGRCDLLAANKGFKGLKPVNGNIAKSNNPKYYFIMKNPIARCAFEYAKVIKHIFKG